MQKTDTSQAIFGSFDGLTSLIGLLAGALVVHATGGQILAEAGGLAVAAAVGMASGDFLSGSTVRLSLIMGISTLIGSLVAAVPVALIGGVLGYALAVVVSLVMAVLIAETRSRSDGRLRGYASTFIILVLASALSVGVSVLLGAVG